MSNADTRGFIYALDSVHQRARHRVDTAAGLVDRCRQSLSKAQHEVEHAEGRIVELAQRMRPATRAAIDPALALVTALQMQAMRQQVADACTNLGQHEEALAQARRRLDQALIEREAFEVHRADALRSHLMEVERRQQTSVDHDWLARRHWQQSAWVGSHLSQGKGLEEER